MNDGFYTLKGYLHKEHPPLSAAMEDYLEMIFRLGGETASVRITELARALHVSPSSASKMAGNLRAAELIRFPRYGYITLTDPGRDLGAYLIRRHQLAQRLLDLINGGDSDLEEVEKLEHFLSPKTVRNLETFLQQHDKKDP